MASSMRRGRYQYLSSRATNLGAPNHEGRRGQGPSLRGREGRPVRPELVRKTARPDHLCGWS